MLTARSHDANESLSLGKILGRLAPPNCVIALFGDLGSGKTHFVKGCVEGFAGCGHEEVSSPTYAYLHIYGKQKKVYHFDLYRLNDAEEFFGMGFDEYFDTDGLTCIEWSEKIASYLPQDTLYIRMEKSGENERLLNFSSHNSALLTSIKKELPCHATIH